MDEIKRILGQGSKNIDDSEWERILDEVDEDGNGEISFEEFKLMMYKLLGMSSINDTSKNEESYDVKEEQI